MEYGEPSEEELKSYTDTARGFKQTTRNLISTWLTFDSNKIRSRMKRTNRISQKTSVHSQIFRKFVNASTATRHTLHATKFPNLRMHSQLKSRLLISTQRLPPARQIPALKLINRLRLSLRAHLMLPRKAWMWTHSFEMSFNHISVANLPQMLPRSLTCALSSGRKQHACRSSHKCPTNMN